MSKHFSERVIGIHEGQISGPLVIVIGALHGNEPAGALALQQVFEQLEKESRDKPQFQFRGKLVGLIGNLQAYRAGQRFLDRDLNRVWAEDFLEKTKDLPTEGLAAESREALDLFDIIAAECQSNKTEQTVFLDLHTTSAEGGIFSIPTDNGESLRLAKRLGAPAILGFHQSMGGTLMGFAGNDGFSPIPNPRSPIPNSQSPICVAFEAGQHESPHSVWRASAAIVRCLRSAGCIGEGILRACEEASPLPLWPHSPPVLQLSYVHRIDSADGFRMRPGYANFQPIQQGEHLADDVRGPVRSPEQGLILMPLYQAKGSDGFFIVE